MSKERDEMGILATDAWNESYARHENYVFWPCDEIVRFVSKYLRRRTGINSFSDVLVGAEGSKVLDLGCGIGRNLHFGVAMGLDMYGIDLSERAVEQAKQWMSSGVDKDWSQRILAGDVRHLPWEDGFFDHAVSDSVLDSMGTEVAQAGVAELARVLKSGGYFYCNLIAQKLDSGDALSTTEERKAENHERGTIQSYFDQQKIVALFGSNFSILKQELHMITDVIADKSWGRWHLVLRRT